MGVAGKYMAQLTTIVEMDQASKALAEAPLDDNRTWPVGADSSGVALTTVHNRYRGPAAATFHSFIHSILLGFSHVFCAAMPGAAGVADSRRYADTLFRAVPCIIIISPFIVLARPVRQ